MIIHELKIKNLYGFMNKTIKLKNNIAILVGINGSGKTSVLNIISWLLKPSFQDLCLIEFDEITLKFTYLEDMYLLKSIQNDVEIIIELENLTAKKVYTPIQANFKQHPKKLRKNENLKKSLAGKYEELIPEDHEKELWQFLFYVIPTPIVIGLDRRLYIKTNDRLYVNAKFVGDIKEDIDVDDENFEMSPLDNVRALLNFEYNTYRNNALILNSKLNEKIMVSAFDEIFTKDNIATLSASPKPSIESIELVKKKVIDTLKENQEANKRFAFNKRDNNISVKKVNNYFDNLKNIIKVTSNSSDKNDLLYITNISQFKKINDLVLEFTKFEDEKKALYSEIDGFLGIINKFFIDSSKQLHFNKVSSDIKFIIFDKKGEKIEEGMDIRNLSSGEKQILILLTYIKYNSNKSIFIIDEPELSLHPKWQAEFLESVEKLMPKDTQLIVATHSPEIIGNKKDYCTVLLPYNS
jgi:predicted ATP-dependent endonuclease of OLD family